MTMRMCKAKLTSLVGADSDRKMDEKSIEGYSSIHDYCYDATLVA